MGESDRGNFPTGPPAAGGRPVGRLRPRQPHVPQPDSLPGAGAGARFAGVWVDVAPEVAYARLLANRERPSRSNVPDASFRQITEEFEPPVNKPDVIRWQPGMEIEELILELEMSLSQSCHPEP
ncbi:MAG TPA: hypothetical protein VGR22_02315 [Thermomicrobiales bacterium]|nr:hypothetical protein [Thermomicrobiales bacterium]